MIWGTVSADSVACKVACGTVHYKIIQQCLEICIVDDDASYVKLCVKDGCKDVVALTECVEARQAFFKKYPKPAEETALEYVVGLTPWVVRDSFSFAGSLFGKVKSMATAGLDSTGITYAKEKTQQIAGRSRGNQCFMFRYPPFPAMLVDFSERSIMSEFNPLVQYVVFQKAICTDEKVVISGVSYPALGAGINPSWSVNLAGACSWPFQSQSASSLFVVGVATVKNCHPIGHVVAVGPPSDEGCFVTAAHVLDNSYWMIVPIFSSDVHHPGGTNSTWSRMVSDLTWVRSGDLAYTQACVGRFLPLSGPYAHLLTYSAGEGLVETIASVRYPHGAKRPEIQTTQKINVGTSGSPVFVVHEGILRLAVVSSVISGGAELETPKW